MMKRWEYGNSEAGHRSGCFGEVVTMTAQWMMGVVKKEVRRGWPSLYTLMDRRLDSN